MKIRRLRRRGVFCGKRRLEKRRGEDRGAAMALVAAVANRLRRDKVRIVMAFSPWLAARITRNFWKRSLTSCSQLRELTVGRPKSRRLSEPITLSLVDGAHRDRLTHARTRLSTQNYPACSAVGHRSGVGHRRPGSLRSSSPHHRGGGADYAEIIPRPSARRRHRLMFSPVAKAIERRGLPAWVSGLAIVILFIALLSFSSARSPCRCPPGSTRRR